MLLSRFLGWFFKHLYTTWARLYDVVAWSVSFGAWNDWVRSLLPNLKSNSILELGHGPGYLQTALHAQGTAVRVVGFDASKQMGLLAKQRLLRVDFTPALVCGYAQSLPFSSACFQQVVATFPSEYIAHPHTLREIQRVLLPDGELLILLAAIPRNCLLRMLFYVTGQAPAQTALQDFGEQFCIQLRQAGFANAHATIHQVNTASLLVVRGAVSSTKQ